MSVQLQWRLDGLERKINDTPKSYEYYALLSRVDSLERSLREACTTIDELRSELERHKEDIRQLET